MKEYLKTAKLLSRLGEADIDFLKLVPRTLDQVMREYARSYLIMKAGSYEVAAKELGVSEATLYRLVPSKTIKRSAKRVKHVPED